MRWIAKGIIVLLLISGARLDAVSPTVGYNVYRSTTSGGPYTRLNWTGSLGDPPGNVGPVACCSYTDNSVTHGVTYYYVVTAFAGVSCGTGCYYATSESQYSSEASATPTSSVVVTWSAPSGSSAPTVTTTTATSITSTSASSGGVVSSNGGASVTSEGVCYATTANPTTPCTSDGTATPFTSSLSSLTPSTLYYYRAFATNSVGTSYGSDLSFTTTATTPVAPAVTLLALKVISPKPIKPWKVAHTLNHVPTVIIPSMTSAGNIWWTAVDGTNISLMGSASGLTAVFYVE